MGFKNMVLNNLQNTMNGTWESRVSNIWPSINKIKQHAGRTEIIGQIGIVRCDSREYGNKKINQNGIPIYRLKYHLQ